MAMTPLVAMRAAMASQLDTSTKLVLTAWCSHVDAEGVAWPGVRLLCEHTSLSDRSVREALSGLRAAGVLVPVASSAAGTTVYRLDLEALAACGPVAKPRKRKAASPVPPAPGSALNQVQPPAPGPAPSLHQVQAPPAPGADKEVMEGARGRGHVEPPGGPPQAPSPGGEVWLAAWAEVCPGVEYALGGRADARALREIRIVAGGDDVMLEACRAYLQAESGRRKVWPPDEGVSPRKMARQVGGWCTAARATLQARPAPPAADSTEAYEPAWSLEAHASGWTLSVDGLAWACTDELAAMAAALAEAHAGTALLSAARHAELLEQLHAHPSSDRLTA